MNKEELEKKVNELETTLNSVELNAKVLIIKTNKRI